MLLHVFDCMSSELVCGCVCHVPPMRDLSLSPIHGFTDFFFLLRIFKWLILLEVASCWFFLYEFWTGRVLSLAWLIGYGPELLRIWPIYLLWYEMFFDFFCASSNFQLMEIIFASIKGQRLNNRCRCENMVKKKFLSEMVLSSPQY